MVQLERELVVALPQSVGAEVLLLGWVHRLRALARTTFIVLRDHTGDVQCVGGREILDELALKLDDVIRIHGKVRADERSRAGFEVDIISVQVLNPSGQMLPFNASTEVSGISPDVILEHRPLSLRHDRGRGIFTVQAAILQGFRKYLESQRFTEIITSKFVAGGTEGGTNLFEVKYFDRTAYLAQSPQLYKEYGVVGFERVFETGHVYRAEPHATSRHLTEYYSLDLEMGFISGPEDIILLEKKLLTQLFEDINVRHGEILKYFGASRLPSMMDVPTWEFSECLERLHKFYGRHDLIDDLDPEAERQLCALADKECGVAAVFVLGFPLQSRPFYTHPRGEEGASGSFDLLFRGLEITTGGQRLHRRADLERAIVARQMSLGAFAGHLRMYDLGMPPHGGFAIGLERLTAQILGLQNVREATMYPRDRNRLMP